MSALRALTTVHLMTPQLEVSVKPALPNASCVRGSTITTNVQSVLLGSSTTTMAAITYALMVCTTTKYRASANVSPSLLLLLKSVTVCALTAMAL